MRLGFTTGSCAAAGAKAATFMLLTGTEKKQIKILTPKGIEFNAEIININRSENSVSCAVIKDGGDDPDVTTGAHIVSTVTIENYGNSSSIPEIQIQGGTGVGIVTKPGLDQKVGEYAINKVPRQMIKKEILEVCSLCDFHGKLNVTISIPEGLELAKKTFNPRLGIEGGISVLGTSGIVEPMSSQAILDTIKVELNQHKALAKTIAAITPGNYGQDFLLKHYNYDLDKSVKCSNFIGKTLDMCLETGFEKILLTGHIGKLIKVSGGIMNTHSKEDDCRMELLSAAAIRCGCSLDCAKKILNSLTTEEGLQFIMEENKLNETMEEILSKIIFHLKKHTGEKIEIECMIYSNEYGLLAKTKNAEDFLLECRS